MIKLLMIKLMCHSVRLGNIAREFSKEIYNFETPCKLFFTLDILHKNI